MVTVQSITDDFAKNAAKLAETVKGNIAVTVPSDKKGEFIYHLIENGGYPASKKQAEAIFKASKNTESLTSALFACHAITLEKPKFIMGSLLKKFDGIIIYHVKGKVNLQSMDHKKEAGWLYHPA